MTYSIQKHKAPRKAKVARQVSRNASLTLAQLEAIVSSNLRRCPFKAGDWVKFKKPTKPIVFGQIIDIQEDVHKISWGNGGDVPMNVVIELVKSDPANGLIYGTERVKTNMKKITFYGGKIP